MAEESVPALRGRHVDAVVGTGDRTGTNSESRSPYGLNQTIYVNAGYARLLDLVNGYLARGSWWAGDDYEDGLHRFRAHRKWKDERKEGSVGLVVYASRTHYSVPGSGLVIRILHARRFIQEGTRNVSSIPRSVRSRFNDVPNVVEIESHRLWSADGNHFAFHIAQYFTDRDCQCCMASPAGELVYVKRSPLLTAQQRIERITASDLVFLENDSRLRAARSLLQKAIPDAWPQISEEARKFLVTGLFLYEQFEGVRQVRLDMSPISVELSKAVETIIAERILLPFREWCAAHRRWTATSLDTDKKDGRFRRLALFIENPERTTPELGATLHLLETIRTNRKRRSPLLGAFRDFARCFESPSFVVRDSDLTDTLEAITKKYRKGATHSEPQSFDTTDRFLRLLVGTSAAHGQPDRDCFLERLLRATRVRRE